MGTVKKEPRIVATYRIAKSEKERAERRAVGEKTTLAVEVEKFVKRYSKKKQDAKNASDGTLGQ
jgi:hypothetical protein